MKEEDKKKVTKEEAKNILIAELKERQEMCKREIFDLLKKFNCKLDVGMIVKQNMNVPYVDVVALNERMDQKNISK